MAKYRKGQTLFWHRWPNLGEGIKVTVLGIAPKRLFRQQLYIVKDAQDTRDREMSVVKESKLFDLKYRRTDV